MKKRKDAMARKIGPACSHGGRQANRWVRADAQTKADDMRGAPRLVIVPELQAPGAHILAYDPKGVRSARATPAGNEAAHGAYACLTGADVAVVITQWDEFRALDLLRTGKLLAKALMAHVRNSTRTMKALVFWCLGVGPGLEGEG
jgi:UDPglucose 6-dehydrogenase